MTPPGHLDTTFITIGDITERLGAETPLRRLQADFAHAARRLRRSESESANQGLRTRCGLLALRAFGGGVMKIVSWAVLAAAAVAVSSATAPAYAGTIAYTYDDLGRLKTVTYPSGVKITYSYDANGNRTAVVTTP